ncbi:carbohydrate kinase [Pedobacter yulinensis]|uniref:Carbohydrate kinase n=1 Tax=Pedobacter yulinensis TaxID=2126353 RepID=A0A2T3HN06_9SPHI|nr:FGGY family carbohydrate kinase [Pedobacter yulinensis]PST83761.1 carbohydrate kinase [Pedobacter yulinensis]
MYSLGIDLGTSSVKVAVVALETGKCVASAQYPETEAPVKSIQPGWAEQSPADWWLYTCQAIRQLTSRPGINAADIAAIGIAYQMHGLVVVDAQQRVLRDSIIWCDSRAVEIGEQAAVDLGQNYVQQNLLNSPGNFTASKLAWVKQHEPVVYNRIHTVMLPGDFIAMQLTGETTTTLSGLSEGVFWDFGAESLSERLMQHYGFDPAILPVPLPAFAIHGHLKNSVASELGLKAGLPVSYKAGDQPNNAFSLNVLEPGAVAATAGTSGVIYGVSDRLAADPLSRINTFAHVNHHAGQLRTGVLLCINGTGSMYRWAREHFAPGLSYAELNSLAALASPGAAGLSVLPFGNGAERMLGNRYTGAGLSGIDLNRHGRKEIFRAVQEGIVYAFRYGLDIMRENGLQPRIIRAGQANLFLSDVFAQAFVDVTGVPVELYDTDGSTGAALGAAIGASLYRSAPEAFSGHHCVRALEPRNSAVYEPLYAGWKNWLENEIRSTP